MPLSPKGKVIRKAMEKEYGEEKGEKVFYASRNKGVIKGVDKAKSKALKKKMGIGIKGLSMKEARKNDSAFRKGKEMPPEK